jgi:hypothetical protein
LAIKTLLNLTKKEWLLLVLFLTLLAFPLQYICRFLDMSTLTSWRWAFAEIGPARVFIPIAITALLMIPLSGVSLPETYPKVCLFIAAILSSLPFLNSPEVLLDSARYFLQAKYLAQHGLQAFFREWGREINPWTDLPLVPLIYGLLFKVFGEGKQIIAIYNGLLFSFVPVLTYLTGKQLWDRQTGFIGSILVLASPYLFTQVPLILVDIHTMFFLLLAVYTFLHTLKHGGFLWTLASGMTIVLALACKYSTWPMLGVLGVIIVISYNSQPQAVMKRALAVGALTFCLLGVFYFWKGAVIMQQLHFLRTYQLTGLKRWQEGYLAAFFFQAHPFIIPAALFALYRALSRRDRKILILGWFAALVFILELKRVRYLLPLLPFLALTGAYGLQAIPHMQVRKYIAYCCMLSSLVVALLAYKPFLAGTSMANLKDAGKFLDTLSSEAVEVYCLPQAHSLGNTSVAVPILDLYTDKIIFQEQSWSSVTGQQRAHNASLRFTWELGQPDYYRLDEYSNQKLPLVIIASEPIIAVPLQLKKKYSTATLLRQFTKSSGVFRYQTFISVFDPI